MEPIKFLRVYFPIAVLFLIFSPALRFDFAVSFGPENFTEHRGLDQFLKSITSFQLTFH